METIKEIRKMRAARLKAIRIEMLGENSTAADMARRCGIAEATYRTLESGSRSITEKWAIKITNALNIPLDKLWRGSNKIENFPPPVAPKSIPRLSWAAVGGLSRENMSFKQAISATPDFIQLPSSVVPPLKDCGALVSSDESMAPEFPAGTTLLFSSAVEWHPGDFVLARIYGVADSVFRKYTWVGDDPENRPIVKLSPLNSAYPSKAITLGVTGEIIARLVMAISVTLY
jgi:SOS-response transcriptional repressor LexA